VTLGYTIAISCWIIMIWPSIKLGRLAAFGDLQKKKHRNAWRGFAREFLWFGQRYRPG